MTVEDVLPEGQSESVHNPPTNTARRPFRGPTYPHRPARHELTRAARTAKTLEEQLEIAALPVHRRVARWLRAELFDALNRFDD